jgi:hypothetical protein
VGKLPSEEQHRRKLLQEGQYEMQLLWREQPVEGWTQGEQQVAELLQGRQ